MVIKCILSGSMETIEYSVKQCWELPPLPEYMAKRGPYVKNQKGAAHQIVILYEFDRSRLKEAWRRVSEQMDFWRAVGGLAISAHISEKT